MNLLRPVHQLLAKISLLKSPSAMSSITNDPPKSTPHSASGSQFQVPISSTSTVSSNDIVRYLNNQTELLTDETKFYSSQIAFRM